MYLVQISLRVQNDTIFRIPLLSELPLHCTIAVNGDRNIVREKGFDIAIDTVKHVGEMNTGTKVQCTTSSCIGDLLY